MTNPAKVVFSDEMLQNVQRGVLVNRRSLADAVAKATKQHPIAREAKPDPNTFAFRQFKKMKKSQQWYFNNPGRVWEKTRAQRLTYYGIVSLVTLSTLQTFYTAVKVATK